jgi:Gliding motility associated protein GldN
MRKIPIVFILIITVFSSFAQTSHSNSILVRHDTSLLNSAECEWIIKSLIKNDAQFTSAIGKSVPLLILEAIEKGKLKAIDGETNKPIPGKEIFTWQMERDTVAVMNDEGNISKYEVVQKMRDPEKINKLKIYQDWYFDLTTSKFQSEIKWIELLEEVYDPSGIFIGYKPLCRIYY